MITGRARITAAATTVVVATGACAQIIGAEFDSARLEPAKTHDASLDAPVVREASPTCKPRVPPERPSLPTATDEIEFTVVVSSVDFGDNAPDGGTPGYLTTGYDLDGLCSGPN